MMKIKASINLNRISDIYLTDFEHARLYYAKHGVELEFIFKNISVRGYKSYWNSYGSRWLIEGAEKLVQADPTCDVDAFVFDQAEWATPPGSQFPLRADTPTGSCFIPINKPFVNIGTYTSEHLNGQTWIQIAHEFMHALVRIANAKGFAIPDVMDTYRLNAEPDNPLSNFSQQWILLQPFLSKNSIILGMRTLRLGDKGEDVRELQKLLNIASDGDFGKNTLKAVKDFQNATGLVPDGIVGAFTFGKLKVSGSKLDSWISGIKDMEGAKPERNNPGNLRYVGQEHAVNDNGFCKFDTYQHGYDALKNLLIRACTGKSSVYKPEMTLYEFYGKYAPASDGNNPLHYAEFVAKRIGVSPTTQIKYLI